MEKHEYKSISGWGYAFIMLNLSVLSSVCLAEELSKKDDKKEGTWWGSIDTKIWVNEWETNTRRGKSEASATSSPSTDPKDTITTITESASNHNRQVMAGYEAAVIPVVSFGYQFGEESSLFKDKSSLFVEGSYYTNTSFNFADDTQTTTQTITYADTAIHPVPETKITTAKFSTQGSRSEWDISLNYKLLPEMGFRVGYKEVNLEVDTLKTGSAGTNETINDKNKFSGPILGIFANVPIDDALNRVFSDMDIIGEVSVYGSYTHGFMDWTYSSVNNGRADQNQTAHSSADYDVAELGLRYKYNDSETLSPFYIKNASIFTGYRYQRLQYDIQTQFTNTGKALPFIIKDATDTTQGFVAGVNIGF